MNVSSLRAVCSTVPKVTGAGATSPRFAGVLSSLFMAGSLFFCPSTVIPNASETFGRV